MKAIRSLELFHVLVPLRKPIRHASFERTESDNLVVRATLADGTVGYGEGVPRSYVTGETIESTFATLGGFDLPRALGAAPGDLTVAVGAIRAIELPGTAADPRGMAGNAARCALELALLDAYARAFGATVGEALALGVDRPDRLLAAPRPVRYSGAITAESRRGEVVSAGKMRLYGFHQVKVKVGVPGQDDGGRLRRIRRILGPRVDVRVDANEAWPAAEVVDRVRPILAARPSALEQPVPHAEVEALATIRPRLVLPDGSRLPVMLDESLCGFPDAVRAVEHDLADILNVRLSKCGGIFPSLRIIALAHEAGRAVQLGCHPGETGLLSAAGRHVAARTRGIRYLEGSYDRHVLARNLIREDITFRYGGRARPLVGPGLGVTVDPEALGAMTVARREVSYG